MTLNVSLRVPDGIVLASDSLSTLVSFANQKMNVSGTCDSCGKPVEIKDVQTPPLRIPSSTWPYAQKMYPIQERYGLATHGSGMVNKRSIYNHIIELGPNLPDVVEGEDHLEKLSNFVVGYFHGQLLAEWKKLGITADLQPDNLRPFGFQLVGFSRDENGDPNPITYLLDIGKAPLVRKFSSIGCTWSGDGSVVGKLWSGGQSGASYDVFSLQDAIDYAKFLIKTTGDYQRFSGNLPTVGGDIDVALITNHRGFRWISQKELYRTLDMEVGKS
jgi:hypothetical protein